MCIIFITIYYMLIYSKFFKSFLTEFDAKSLSNASLTIFQNISCNHFSTKPAS
jgi:hypothetical protein